jgi:hypothetical protein
LSFLYETEVEGNQK